MSERFRQAAISLVGISERPVLPATLFVAFVSPGLRIRKQAVSKRQATSGLVPDFMPYPMARGQSIHFPFTLLATW